jgi:hypothetical protein
MLKFLMKHLALQRFKTRTESLISSVSGEEGGNIVSAIESVDSKLKGLRTT